MMVTPEKIPSAEPRCGSFICTSIVYIKTVLEQLHSSVIGWHIFIENFI